VSDATHAGQTFRARAPRPGMGPGVGLARPGAGRRMAVAVIVVVAVMAGIATLSLEGARRATRNSVTASADPQTLARADAVAFLSRYLATDGRVIRRDYGGDTVSEGQAYAMLLAVAVGNRRQFALAWQWERTHLQQPDGLFAYHWANGAIVGVQSAADADLDTAWALVLAGARFGSPTYLAQGRTVAAAVLTNETAAVAGRLELVAGPWARTNPAVVDPSYLSPQAMAALASATGDPRWSELASGTTALVTSLAVADGTGLVPNWAQVASDGSVRAVGTPSGSGTPAFGLDAQRVPVWLASSCSATDRSLAGREWPVLQRAHQHGAALSYSLSGVSTSGLVNPLGLVAAAAAARAAGYPSNASSLLAQADRQSQRFPTYYGDAWGALGRVLLDTSWLSSCPTSG
jgi:endo-1,4-beta-D-glucanase Y